MKAMLLCAGLGMRMRPLTEHTPKPLIEVFGRTLLDRSLDWFWAAGVDSVIVNIHYKAEMIAAHLQGRKHPAITLSHEPVLLETGGGIAKALPLLGDAPFFSANSDALCIDGKTPALQRLANAWDDATMDALLLVAAKSQAIGIESAGDFFIDAEGGVRRRGDAQEAPYIFTGIQLLHPRLFHNAPSGPFSMNLLYDRSMMRVKAIVHDGLWLHVGDAKGLAQASLFFSKL